MNGSPPLQPYCMYYVCVLRPLADSEQLPTRTHRSAEVLKSPGGDGDGETITPEPKKKTRKDKKEKKKVKDKERTASFNTTLDALSFSLTPAYMPATPQKQKSKSRSFVLEAGD